MGGFGSGRQNGGRCTDDCHTLDIRLWQRKGLLYDGAGFGFTWSVGGKTTGSIYVLIDDGFVLLIYGHWTDGGEWEQLDNAVTLQTTPCHYGGVRYWFTCPAVGCGKRVAVLYQNDTHFVCRNCCQLAYRCQRQTLSDRLIHRADKLRKKLDWEPGVLNGRGWKPKGMHWKTFERLQAEHDKFANAGLDIMLKRLNATL